MSDRVPTEERYKQIAPLVEQGLPATEIAVKIGLSKSYTQMLVTRGRREGKLPHGRPRRSTILDKFNIGRPRAQVYNLPEEVQIWIADQMPEGSTIAEFMVACVVDQYYEEMGE